MKNRVTVISGTNYGDSNAEQEACENLGIALACSGRKFIYDGHEGGLINLLFESFHKKGGHSIGIFCSETKTHYTLNEKISESRIVDTIAEQNVQLIQIADAFVFLPNFSLNSLKILFELIYRTNQNLNEKPVAFLCSEEKMDLILKMLNMASLLTNSDCTLNNFFLNGLNPYSLLNQIDQYYYSQ